MLAASQSLESRSLYPDLEVPDRRCARRRRQRRHRRRFVGTQRAPFRGTAPTGATVEASVVHVDRVDGGLLGRHVTVLDGEALRS